MFDPNRNISLQDRIRGSLLGGAMGDALGYAVEFDRNYRIVAKYGPAGITAYEPDPASGLALISDDTQMTLFTAEGILTHETEGLTGSPCWSISQAYQNWLLTQERHAPVSPAATRLMAEPRLYSPRAPGNTCLSALRADRAGYCSRDLYGEPRNHSKGCGGVMRVAPIALYYRDRDIRWVDQLAADASALTHGHPLGYLPSALLCHILHRLLTPAEQPMTLKQIVVEAMNCIYSLFSGTPELATLCKLMDKVLLCAENQDSDRDNIRLLGEGWVGEEALAIAVYCALRHEHDFSAGLIAAVNHDGDSDSTGAIAGNILGAVCGYEAIEEKWKTRLELRELLLETADALYEGPAAPTV